MNPFLGSYQYDGAQEISDRRLFMEPAGKTGLIVVSAVSLWNPAHSL
jgi:hypothetical protein